VTFAFIAVESCTQAFTRRVAGVPRVGTHIVHDLGDWNGVFFFFLPVVCLECWDSSDICVSIQDFHGNNDKLSVFPHVNIPVFPK
jgi:hypothetical protein